MFASVGLNMHDPNSPAYKKARRQYAKATKNRQQDIDNDWTPFRAAEKIYKARFPPPDLSNVLDLALNDPARADEISLGIWAGRPDAVDCQYLSDKVVTIPQIPGLVILPSFVPPEKQRQLVQWALSDHARHPNDTNLDIHYNVPPEGVWQAHLRARADPSVAELVQPKTLEESEVAIAQPAGPRQLVNNTPASPDTLSVISATPKPPQPPSATVQQILPTPLLYKMRWANIGWFYHWGTKQYDFAKGKGHIDSELRKLCQSAVAAVDWDKIFSGTESQWPEARAEWKDWEITYEPDAGIVNFYQEKDTLMAHVDRSEVCATSPLVSISLGNASVFLIGGHTRDSAPVPILLRSGDVVIMSGPACRRAYHGVPRILESTLPPHLRKECLGVDEQESWVPYEEYMLTTRINVNARQVFPKGFDPGVVQQDS